MRAPQYNWSANSTFGVRYARNLAVRLFQEVARVTPSPRRGPMSAQDLLLARGELAAAMAGTPRALWYVMGPDEPGARGEYWEAADALPASRDTALYLAPGGTLSLQVRTHALVARQRATRQPHTTPLRLPRTPPPRHSCTTRSTRAPRSAVTTWC